MIDKSITTLYKYLPKQYANNMMNLGQIRIGTLLDFQDEKSYGSVIGDQTEGYRQVSVGDRSGGEAVNGQVGGVTFENFSFKGGGMTIRQSVQHDYYVYCTSYDRDIAIQNAFSVDAAVEIFDVEGFFRSVTEQLKALKYTSDNGFLQKCIYEDKQVYIAPQKGKVNYNHPVTPVWRQKEVKYAYQKEVRALWTPTNPKLVPIAIEVPDISNFCRLAYL